MNSNLSSRLTNGIYLKKKNRLTMDDVDDVVQECSDEEIEEVHSEVKLEEKKVADSKRKKSSIHTKGNDIDPLIETNEHLKDKINSIVFSNYMKNNYTSLFPVQQQSIPLILKRRNILVVAPTGSGKTFTFLLPILSNLLSNNYGKGLKCLIISPTHELSLQTYQRSKELVMGTKLKIAEASQTFGKRLKRINKRLSKIDVLLSTPKLFENIIRHCGDGMKLNHLQYFVVDECDKMFEEKKEKSKDLEKDGFISFRNQFITIFNKCKFGDKDNDCRCCFLSATYSFPLREWCEEIFPHLVQVTIGQRNSSCHNVHQKLCYVGNENGKFYEFTRLLKNEEIKSPILIFLQCCQRVKELYLRLDELVDKFQIGMLHSHMSIKKREDIINQFHSGTIKILICTDLIGRGVDFKDIKFVINYDFPPTSINYIHRIGRTGRSKQNGNSITFFVLEDIPILKKIGNVIKEAGCPIDNYIMNFKKPSRGVRKRYEKTAGKRLKKKAIEQLI
ncbi:hypothetical protein SNEBB_003938 [Seison nebaliae]|nr:hypothetical protein SNEBB_003938 [Seison nebaliae]